MNTGFPISVFRVHLRLPPPSSLFLLLMSRKNYILPRKEKGQALAVPALCASFNPCLVRQPAADALGVLGHGLDAFLRA